MRGERSLVSMSLKMAGLAVFGLCAGGIIAAGVFAFLAIIGIFRSLEEED